MNKLLDRKKIDFKSIIIIITYAALMILSIIYFETILAFLGKFFGMVKPFIIGFILAFLLNIPMKMFERHIHIKHQKLKRTLCGILAIVFTLGIFSILLLVVIPQVVDNLKSFVDNMPSLVSQLQGYITSLDAQFQIPEIVFEKLLEFQNELGELVIRGLTSWGPTLASGVTLLTSSAISTFLSIAIACYMLFSKNVLISQVKRVGRACLNDDVFNKTEYVLKLTSTTFENFLAGQLTESLLVGIACYLVCLAAGMPYASIIAVIFGFTNIIPYFGPIIGTMVCALLIFFVSPIKALIFIGLGTALQQAESILLYPHVVGKKIGLSAIWVLFAVTVGGGMFGLVGMIFGLPAFSVIYELFKQWINKRLNDKKKEKEVIVIEELPESV